MSTTTANIDKIEKASVLYHVGRDAFLAGGSVDNNSYYKEHGMSNQRTQWFTGWYDAKYARYFEEQK